MFGIKRARLSKYDYQSNGYYFVTIVADWRQQIFSGRKDLVRRLLVETAQLCQGVHIDTCNVMPNHVHMIVVLEDSSVTLGEVVRKFKAKVSYALGTKAWQPNYYEHVIRDEKSLNRIREYIINNPRN